MNAAVLSRAKGGCSQCGAVVPGGWLHKDFVKSARLRQFSVGRAIEGDTAGKSKTAQPGARPKMLADVKHDAVETLLERCSNVAMLVSYLLVWMAWLDQMLGEAFSRSEVIFAFVARAVHTKKRDSNGPIFAELDGLLEERAKARRVTVGRQTHDLVLVCVEVESKMQSYCGIENADGITGRHFFQPFQLSVAGMIDRGALHLSHAVNDENQALFPTRAKISACRMSQVMIDVADPVRGVAIQIASDLCTNSFTGVDISEESGRDWVKTVDRAMRGEVERVGNLVHVA